MGQLGAFPGADSPTRGPVLLWDRWSQDCCPRYRRRRKCPRSPRGSTCETGKPAGYAPGEGDRRRSGCGTPGSSPRPCRCPLARAGGTGPPRHRGGIRVVGNPRFDRLDDEFPEIVRFFRVVKSMIRPRHRHARIDRLRQADDSEPSGEVVRVDKPFSDQKTGLEEATLLDQESNALVHVGHHFVRGIGKRVIYGIICGSGPPRLGFWRARERAAGPESVPPVGLSRVVCVLGPRRLRFLPSSCSSPA